MTLALIVSILILLENNYDQNLINKVNFSFIKEEPRSLDDNLEMNASIAPVYKNNFRVITNLLFQAISKKFQFNNINNIFYR